MKGLLLKDLYTIWGYMRAFLALCIVLILGGRFAANNSFLMYYPCILSSLITVTLIAYDEREKWDAYTRTLPTTKAQYVSSKYFICLMITAVIVTVICLVQLTAPNGYTAIPTLLLALIPMSLLPSAVMMPFIFWFGAEKGRMIYSLVLGGFCGILVLLSNQLSLVNTQQSILLRIGTFPGLVILISSVAAYAFSWWLSIQFYKDRPF